MQDYNSLYPASKSEKFYFYRNTLMLASGIKGIRVQLGIESDPSSTIFMRRRLGCPVCLQRGASPPFH
ncbi:MAG: hypothetical protein METHSR3v1_880001, partial [Methanothrix sp.]